ncbi:CENPF protein, partial [Amia calva]|nr:CENPF protein [Amia calva]
MAWATTATQTVTPCGREVGTADVATQTDMTAETEPDTEQDAEAEAQVEGAGGGQSQLFAQAFPLPADPAQIAERIRRNRGRMSAAFDDTEYEPYGLPEVVMKGFADIPSGPACPYVLRRGLLGTATLPSLQPPSAPAKDREPPPTD